jgi:uncharacterized protein YqjF (DUF2071 family)
LNHPALSWQQHRPWPLPSKPWIVKQSWRNLLFLHWEIDSSWLKQFIPQGLELDLFEDRAWLGVVPFQIDGIGRRDLPSPAWLCSFPEFNLRTYVTDGSKRGVWFFSLDIPNPLAVWAARTFYHLPYHYARMRLTQSDGKTNMFVQRGRRSFQVAYQGLEPMTAQPGSFEHWATERYCLYSQDLFGGLHRAEIHHRPWPLYSAETKITDQSFLNHWGIQGAPRSPMFSASIDVVVYPLECLGKPAP